MKVQVEIGYMGDIDTKKMVIINFFDEISVC